MTAWSNKRQDDGMHHSHRWCITKQQISDMAHQLLIRLLSKEGLTDLTLFSNASFKESLYSEHCIFKGLHGSKTLKILGPILPIYQCYSPNLLCFLGPGGSG